MHQYNLKEDLSRKCTDYIILNNKKEPIEKNFQCDDSFQTEDHLASIVKKRFFTQILFKHKIQLFNLLDSLMFADNSELLMYHYYYAKERILTLLIRNTTPNKSYLWRHSNINQRNPFVCSIYWVGYIPRGINGMSAIGVSMHKILRIIYGILKLKNAFDPETDLQNKIEMAIKRKCLTGIKAVTTKISLLKNSFQDGKEGKEWNMSSSPGYRNTKSGIFALVPIT